MVLLCLKHAASWKVTPYWQMGHKFNKSLLVNQTRYRAEIKYLGSTPHYLAIEKIQEDFSNMTWHPSDEAIWNYPIGIWYYIFVSLVSIAVAKIRYLASRNMKIENDIKHSLHGITPPLSSLYPAVHTWK